MARQASSDTRDRVLTAAGRLFNGRGVHVVGLQQVIDEAGLGKSSVYREFTSKDELVAAWLHQDRELWWAMTTEVLATHDGRPDRQLLAIVEAVQAQVHDDDYRGCPFHNTHAEFPDPDHPANREATEHVGQIHGQLLELATAAGANDPAALADELMLIIDGMYANSPILGPSGPTRSGVALAAARIREHTGR
jgi:AcrR family transcriptional regulator